MCAAFEPQCKRSVRGVLRAWRSSALHTSSSSEHRQNAYIAPVWPSPCLALGGDVRCVSVCSLRCVCVCLRVRAHDVRPLITEHNLILYIFRWNNTCVQLCTCTPNHTSVVCLVLRTNTPHNILHTHTHTRNYLNDVWCAVRGGAVADWFALDECTAQCARFDSEECVLSCVPASIMVLHEMPAN